MLEQNQQDLKLNEEDMIPKLSLQPSHVWQKFTHVKISKKKAWKWSEKWEDPKHQEWVMEGETLDQSSVYQMAPWSLPFIQ